MILLYFKKEVNTIFKKGIKSKTETHLKRFSATHFLPNYFKKAFTIFGYLVYQ